MQRKARAHVKKGQFVAIYSLPTRQSMVRGLAELQGCCRPLLNLVEGNSLLILCRRICRVCMGLV